MILLADANHTAIRNVADNVFELDSSVEDVKAFAQLVVDLTQDALAGRRWYIRNPNVAGQSVGI